MTRLLQPALDFETTPADSLESAFRRVHRQVKPRTPVPAIRTRFYPSVGANHNVKLERGTLTVRVSDLFEDAPAHIFETIAAILLSKLYKTKLDARHNDIYRRYTMSEPMLERARRARAERGRPGPTTDPRGRRHDLDRLFDALNREYFDSGLPKPALSWTRRATRTLLGRYDFDQDTVFVSRSLDSPGVPEHVVRYILFHEMLHVKHGARIRNGRKLVHTAEFRREERGFTDYAAANDWLQRRGNAVFQD